MKSTAQNWLAQEVQKQLGYTTFRQLIPSMQNLRTQLYVFFILSPFSNFELLCKKFAFVKLWFFQNKSLP